MLTESFQNVVALCKGHGRIGESLPIDEINQFLAEKQSGLRVLVTDDLCQPQVLSGLIQEHGRKPIVIGACSRLNTKANSFALDPHQTRVVDLIKEIESAYDSVDLADRVKLLLCAQVKRQAGLAEIPPQGRKLSFTKPQGEVSRRELFEMLLPEYQVIPYVESARCVGGERCQLCQRTCAFEAVVIEEERVSIDELRCRGCGACAAVCPHSAIHYPTFTFDQLGQEMEGLLIRDGDMLEPRIIALTCQKGKASRCCYPANILPMELPCLVMTSPWLMLRTFDLGAQGLALISGEAECQFGFDPDRWQSSVQFVQELLDRLGIAGKRIRTFGADNLEQELAQFAQEIAKLNPTPLRLAEPVADRLKLPALISSLGKKLEIPLEGTIANSSVPFGKLKLDSSQCTGCGLCALHCPTAALTLLQGSDATSYELFFQYASCVACGQCVSICPEGCLHLENILELDRLKSQVELIFEGDMVRCRECGRPIAPRAMIDKLAAKVETSSGLTQHFETCPDCKIKAEFETPTSRMGA